MLTLVSMPNHAHKNRYFQFVSFLNSYLHDKNQIICDSFHLHHLNAIMELHLLREKQQNGKHLQPFSRFGMS